MKFRIAGLILVAGIACAQGRPNGVVENQNGGISPPMAVAPGSAGYLLHRGSDDKAEAAIAGRGGVGLQEKSYELRSWLPNFVLIRRGDYTYQIEDLDTVRHLWALWDESLACQAAMDAATVATFRQALAVCKISSAEITAAQKIREGLEPKWLWNVIGIITQSRIWNALDRAVSDGFAHLI